MGNSLIGSMIYFWIFIFGGMFVGKVTGLIQSDRDTMIFVVILAILYWGFAFLRHARKNRKEE